MKVFLGWSGDRSKALAEALHEWLPLVLHYVKPWMSQNDIAAGERWSQELATELEASNFGLISVTQDNLHEPWILFEAGSLAKSMQDGRVTPFLLDLEISDVSGPLAQFQSKKAAKSGAWDVVCSINKCPQAPVDDAIAVQIFDLAWPKLESKISAIPPATNAKPRRPQHEVLEELVTSVRSFDSRLSRMEEMVDEGRFARSRRGRRVFHPMMIDEIQHMIGKGPGDPIGFLALASIVREDFPPLYELSMEAYRACSSGKSRAAMEAVERLQRMAEFMIHGPMMEEFGGSKEMHMMLRELPRMIDYMVHSLPVEVPTQSPPRKKATE